MTDACRERQVDFYRAWSSAAAEQALAADHPGARVRCAHSAGMWALIADAIEAGQKSEVDHLTSNLLLLKNGFFIAASELDAN
jgi:hypothetical protein